MAPYLSYLSFHFLTYSQILLLLWFYCPCYFFFGLYPPHVDGNCQARLWTWAIAVTATPAATMPGPQGNSSYFYYIFLGGLQHAVACGGISVPRPGSEPQPQWWKHRALTTRLPGNSLSLLILEDKVGKEPWKMNLARKAKTRAWRPRILSWR